MKPSLPKLPMPGVPQVPLRSRRRRPAVEMPKGLPDVLDVNLPGPLPSTGLIFLGGRVVLAAAVPVVRRGDLTAVRHLPFVLTHLDDAAVVAGAINDPVGTAIKAPGAAARFGVRTGVAGATAGIRGVQAAPGFVARGPRTITAGPARVVRRFR